jgi:hypothetical protein
MTNSERLAITLQMIRDNTPYLLQGPPEVVERRFALLRRENELRNQRMLEGIARGRGNRSHPGRTWVVNPGGQVHVFGRRV